MKVLQEQFDQNIHVNIAKSRSYFDETLKLMQQQNLEEIAKAERERRDPLPPLIDFSQYAALQKQWHQVFDKADKNLSNEFSIDPEYRKKTLDAIEAMKTEIDEFRSLQKPYRL